MNFVDTCPLGPPEAGMSLPVQVEVPLTSQEIKQLFKDSNDQITKLVEAQAKTDQEINKLTKAQAKTDQQIRELIHYNKNRDRDLEECASTTLSNYLHDEFEWVRPLSKEERTFYSVNGVPLLECDGGAVFKISDSDQGLAIMEVKQNKAKLPSVEISKQRKNLISTIINGRGVTQPNVLARVQEVSEFHSSLRGVKLFLFYAANNMDSDTRDSLLKSGVSVLSPSGSNFKVQLSLDFTRCELRFGVLLSSLSLIPVF